MRRTGPSSHRRINLESFQVANRGTSREINRQIALNLIRHHQPLSRADLARLMDVRRGAITRLVDDLLAVGLIYEGAKGESSRGRKPMLLHLDTRRRCALGVDVNATRTYLMVTDLLGHPLREVREFPTRPVPGALFRDLARHVRRALDEDPSIECVGMGIVVSGIVDAVRGRLKLSPTLGWRDVDIAGPIGEATGLPVVVENSCKACVLAQVWGARADAATEGPVAFVNISDGVGVGIAVDGKLLRGAHDIAGEFGHVPLSLDGPRCACGQRGCWEAYVASRAVIARYLGLEPSWPDSCEPREVTIEAIIARSAAGEGRAIDILRETGTYLGRGLGIIFKTLDPRRVYLGGELTRAWELLRPPVTSAIREAALIREAGEAEILIVAPEEYPRLRGAAALVSTSAFAAPIVA